MTTAFKVFTDYCALKAHFKKDGYDYFKYSGHISAKPSALERRADKYYFTKLARKVNYKEVLLANFVENDSSWIGDLIEQEAEDNFKSWRKRVESLTYLYKLDLKTLDDDFNSNFIVEDGNHPKLLTLFLQKRISIETMVILDRLVHYRKRWNKQIEDKYIWPEAEKKISQYTPFINIDVEKMKIITFEHFKS